MKFRSSSSLEPQDILDAVPLKDESAVIHRCAWEDLAILTTRPDAVRNAEFFDAERHFLIPYEEAAKGKHPRGISGAAMWWESETEEAEMTSSDTDKSQIR